MSYLQKLSLILGEKTKILYHGTNIKLDRIKDATGGWVEFGGIFANDDLEVAESHGKFIYEMELPYSAILTQQELDYHIDANRLEKILVNETGIDLDNKDDLDVLWKAVIDDEPDIDNSDRLIEILRPNGDVGVAGLEAQALRGKIAKTLGYKAVEMLDEHGKSYLVLPSVEIKLI